MCGYERHQLKLTERFGPTLGVTNRKGSVLRLLLCPGILHDQLTVKKIKIELTIFSGPDWSSTALPFQVHLRGLETIAIQSQKRNKTTKPSRIGGSAPLTVDHQIPTLENKAYKLSVVAEAFHSSYMAG